jgi:signal transduction histidine kinase
MKDFIEVLKEYFPISSVLILIVFGYLLIVLIKIANNLIRIAEKEKEASSNQSERLSERINSIEKELNIKNLTFDFQEKQLKKFHEIAEDQEKSIEQLDIEKGKIRKEFELVQNEYKELIDSLNLKESQINELNNKFKIIELLNKESVENDKDHFYYDITPDIVLIRNASDLISRYSNISNEYKDKWLRRIKNASVQLTYKIINSRLADSNYQIYNSNDNFVVADCVIDVVEILRDESKLNKNIDIELVTNKFIEIFNVHINQFQFSLLFYNILKNAINYSYSDSTIRIVIGLKEDSIFISTSNYGFEILTEEKNLIFNKGYRGENAINYNISGSGQGLFIANRIIKAIGGSLIFFSKVIKDNIFENTFSIVIPNKYLKFEK